MSAGCLAALVHDRVAASTLSIMFDAPLRDASLPTHRDFPVALRGALRVALAFAATAATFVALSRLSDDSLLPKKLEKPDGHGSWGAPPNRHPRNVEIIPKSRDFH